jgi:multiple sugar transport system permease protein
MAVQSARGAPKAVPRRAGGFWGTSRRILGKDWPVAYVFAMPLVLLLFGLIGVQIARAVWLSFHNQIRLTGTYPWVGLQNYQDLWSDTSFRSAVLLTIKFAVISVFIKFWVGLSASLLVHNTKRFRSVFTGLILLPWIVPEVVAALTWRGLFQPTFGGFNVLLQAIGVTSLAQQLGFSKPEFPFISEPGWALWAVIIVNVWKGIPFFTLTLLSGLKSIDAELYDAAAVDGANAWQRFVNITLPGLRYVTIVACLLSLIFTLNAFGLIYVMTGGGPLNGTRLFSILSYELFAQSRYSRATTVAMAIVPALLVLIVILGRYMRGDPSRVQAAETIWTQIGTWLLSALFLVIGGAILWNSLSPLWFAGMIVLLAVAAVVMLGEQFGMTQTEVINNGIRMFCALVGGAGLMVMVFGLRFTLVMLVLLAIFGSGYLDRVIIALRGNRAGPAQPRSVASIQAMQRLGSIGKGTALGALLIFELFPFYWVIATAFKTDAQIQGVAASTDRTTQLLSIFWPQPWTAANFRHMLTETQFLNWFWNTARVATVSMLISVLVAALGAYALMRLKWRGSGVISTGILFSYLMPGIIIFIPLYQTFAAIHRTLLTALPEAVYANNQIIHVINGLGALMIAYPTFGLPFACWLLMGYYRSIPVELEEAALIDGCNHFQAFFKIILPLTKPALLTVALFALTGAFNDFLFAFIFVRPEQYTTLAVGLSKMVIGDIFPFGKMMAASILMAIPVTAVYMLAQRFMVEGLTAGSVKG